MANGPTTPVGAFPRNRMRRNRSHDWSRRLVRENRLNVDNLIWPVFVREDSNVTADVPTMPGVLRYTIEELVDAIGEAKALGIPAVAIFPVVPSELKTSACEEAWNPDNLVCRAIQAATTAHPDIGIICDVALDPYNADGHDGIVRNGEVVNDESIEALCQQAIVQAEAGCQIIAPSDMMDGRVNAIRSSLDAAGFEQLQIMAYAAKYASAFYGPFRDAIGSTGALKGASKETYQMDPANGDEALREVALDLAEGADMIMVKPGLPYLDIIWRIKQKFGVPTYAFNVSGEYALLHYAARANAVDLDQAMMEMFVAFKRAGADGVLSYFALDVARKLSKA